MDEVIDGAKEKGSAATSAVFDLDVALDHIGGEMDFLLELLRLFLDDCPSQLEEIKEAIGRGDSKAVASIAHKITGAVGNFGAPLVYAISQKLELMGRNN